MTYLVMDSRTKEQRVVCSSKKAAQKIVDFHNETYPNRYYIERG